MRGEPTRKSTHSTSAWVRLVRWGTEQHRLVTTAQLRAVGWGSNDVVYRVRSGQLHPVHEQVYSLGGPPQTDQERWLAAVLTFGPGACLSDAAAVELYGWLRYPLGEVHVTTTTERRPRDGIRPHHRRGPRDWRAIGRIPVTSPEQTILDCASTLRSDTLFRRIIRQAQAERATSHVRLVVLAARSNGIRGVARLRAELEEGPSPTRSANEDHVLDLLRSTGIVLPNHKIDSDEVDLFLPEHNVAIEVDSSLHDNPAARAHDAAKQTRLERKGVHVYRIA